MLIASTTQPSMRFSGSGPVEQSETTQSLTPRPSITDFHNVGVDRATLTTPPRGTLTPKPSDFNLRERRRMEKTRMNDDDDAPSPSDPPSRFPSPTEWYDFEEDDELSALSIDPDDDDNDDGAAQVKSEAEDGIPCPGQAISWDIQGSIFETYAYQTQARKAVPWRLEKIANGFIYIRSWKNCMRFLELNDIQRGACAKCSKLRTLPEFREFLNRARTKPKPNMPWRYLNFIQLRDLLLAYRKRIREAEAKVRFQRLSTQHISHNLYSPDSEISATCVQTREQVERLSAYDINAWADSNRWCIAHFGQFSSKWRQS